MAKFDILTSYIAKIKAIDFENVDEWRNNRVFSDFERDVHTFVDSNPDLNLYHYHKVLEEKNIKVNERSINSVDLQSLDGQGVAALIVAIVRAERTNEGVLRRYFREGFILKWLERLKEIDER